MTSIRFAIVDSNMLSCLGLQRLLHDLMPMTEAVLCSSFEDLLQYEGERFIHYFVSSKIYFQHAAFFRDRAGKSIVLTEGEMPVRGVYTIDTCQSEATLIQQLLALKHNGHEHALARPGKNEPEEILSAREKEVAILLCKGLINKEIADKLCISQTTVISHRRNIMEKLHARSLADIIMYAVLHGLVGVEELS